MPFARPAGRMAPSLPWPQAARNTYEFPSATRTNKTVDKHAPTSCLQHQRKHDDMCEQARVYIRRVGGLWPQIWLSAFRVWRR